MQQVPVGCRANLQKSPAKGAYGQVGIFPPFFYFSPVLAVELPAHLRPVHATPAFSWGSRGRAVPCHAVPALTSLPFPSWEATAPGAGSRHAPAKKAGAFCRDPASPAKKLTPPPITPGPPTTLGRLPGFPSQPADRFFRWAPCRRWLAACRGVYPAVQRLFLFCARAPGEPRRRAPFTALPFLDRNCHFSNTASLLLAWSLFASPHPDVRPPL